MMNTTLRQAMWRRRLILWNPHWQDLAVVALSWLLVVSLLRTATSVVTPDRGGLYFIVYGIVTAGVVGLGIPLVWMVVLQRRPLKDLGLTVQHWRKSVVLQAIFATILFVTAFRDVSVPSTRELLPLVALALAIGFFEAVFWRGWVLMRLEESFGLVPAILLGSLLYAAYHVGYAMDPGEMVFLFFVGILFAATFLVTRSVLVLWPVFQPMGQLVTLIEDELELPFLAVVGFLELLVGMLVLVWLLGRYHRRHSQSQGGSR